MSQSFDYIAVVEVFRNGRWGRRRMRGEAEFDRLYPVDIYPGTNWVLPNPRRTTEEFVRRVRLLGDEMAVEVARWDEIEMLNALPFRNVAQQDWMEIVDIPELEQYGGLDIELDAAAFDFLWLEFILRGVFGALQCRQLW